MKKKKKGVQRSHDRCKGEGRGREVANGHMTVGEGGGGGGEGLGKPATLGQPGLSFWAHSARHPWAHSARHPWVRPACHLSPSDPPSIKPVNLKKK